MQQHALRLEAVISPPATQDKRQLAESTASHFEQIFVQQMVKTMRSSGSIGDGEGLFGKDAGSGTYEDWFDMHLGQHLTESGGIGLKQTLLRDWERHGWIEPAASDTDDPTTPDPNSNANPDSGASDVDS